MYYKDFENNKTLQRLVRLGLWEQAILVSEEPSLAFSHYDGLIEVIWASYNIDLDDYYVTSYYVITGN